MHYHAEIHVPDTDDVESQVDDIMVPFYDGNNATTGFWDWWEVGGRWTGAHDGYDPRQNSENYETCNICGGTGIRNDAIGQKARAEDPSYTCNGCTLWNPRTKKFNYGPFGPGKTLKMAFDFKPHAGDVVAVEDIADDLSCYTLIAAGQVFRDISSTVSAKLKDLGIATGFLVTVDYHC